jgi:hypothetical protein
VIFLVAMVTHSLHGSRVTSTNIHTLVDSKPITDDNGVPGCANLDVLDHIIRNTSLLDCIGLYFSKKNKAPRRLLTIIQLVLSNRSLCFFKPFTRIYGFPDAQKAAYLPAVSENLLQDPYGCKINVDWCLHLVNFFRHHLLGIEESGLIGAYKELNSASGGRNLPQYWKEQLGEDEEGTRKPLGKSWKGTYGILNQDPSTS